MTDVNKLRKELDFCRGAQATLLAAVAALLNANRANPLVQLQFADIVARLEAVSIASSLSDDYLIGLQETATHLREEFLEK